MAGKYKKTDAKNFIYDIFMLILFLSGWFYGFAVGAHSDI
jgi:hypothetical protein